MGQYKVASMKVNDSWLVSHSNASSHLRIGAWFFGGNDLGLHLYDPVSKGCSDGLERYGINENQGAESTISFWKAFLYLCTSFD